ncbi:MAG: aminotransferase class I/II-fold pyridoxal phosphate-dependent enzyme, partial [Deltaproteobacteria bacterium]|nr:aminotransferase class I/II-fold pyridoxal phosphate-dependent enzyme [Deltaproteobacteria bacterium]
QAIQEAGIVALRGPDDCVRQYCAIYQQRRDLMVEALRAIGLVCELPRATFFVWASVPKGYTSASFTERVLKETGVVITPGSGFGRNGEGYVRFSLTVSSERLGEAVERIKALRT